MQKPLPHSPEAERAVLGALLLEPERVGRLAERLRPTDFHLAPHRHIYTAALAVAGEGATPDPLTVLAWLRQAGTLEEAGGLGTLAELEDLTLATERVWEWAGLVVERSTRRRLIEAAGEAIRQAATSSAPMPEILGRLSEEILALETRLSSGSGGGEALADILAGDEPKANPSRAGWGWSQADRLTVGFAEQTLTFLAGQAKMGKSAAAASIIRWNARRGRRVLLRSVEEFKRPWGRRLLAQEAGVSLHRLIESKGLIRAGGLHPEELERVALKEAEMASWRVTIVDSAPDARGVAAPDTPEGIVATVLAEHEREPLDLVVVDHLQDVRGDDGWEGIIKAAKCLRTVARHGVPVLVLSQISPKVEGRALKFNPKSERVDWLNALRPTLTDLGGAARLDSIADVVGAVFRPDFFLPDGAVPDGRAELLIRANRYGPTNKIIPLRFNPESTAFEGN